MRERSRNGATYQLPPHWPLNDERVYDLLRRQGVALCLHDTDGSATDKLVVGPFIYVRFHIGTREYGDRYPGHAPRDAVRLRQRIHEALSARKPGM